MAVEYLKAALESLDDPDDRAAGLLALRTVAEAYGGLAVVAAQAGISRESLYRTLSPNGNPTLKTLLAVLKTLGLRLSVEPKTRVRLSRRAMPVAHGRANAAVGKSSGAIQPPDAVLRRQQRHVGAGQREQTASHHAGQVVDAGFQRRRVGDGQAGRPG